MRADDKRHTKIAEIVIEAAKETGREYTIHQWSDSTLRGPLPLETKLFYEEEVMKKHRKDNRR